MKYFFLSEGWIYDRVWEFGGLWDQFSWGRKPEIKRIDCGVIQQNEALWLYAVEDSVLMIEVKPPADTQATSIGQVVLKRLITAEQALDILATSDSIFNSVSNKS